MSGSPPAGDPPVEGTWRQRLRAAPGLGLIRASWAGTAVQTALAVPAVVFVDELSAVYAVVCLLLFAVGTVAFLAAFLLAVQRSRTELIGVGGLYFLAGCAPEVVQRAMLASLALQVLVGLAAASARVYTALAFGILVPMLGLGLSGLWGARYGTFPPRSAST